MSGLLRALFGLLAEKFAYFVVHRGDKAAYLRSLGARIGAGCSIYTTIGNFGSEPYLVELGERVTVTSGVVFLTHDGSSRLFRGRLAGMNPRYGNRFGTIWVGDNCFIGVNSILMPGVRIGPDAIVGAGSVVNQDVPPGMVAAGVPARLICTLDEYIQRYQEKMIPVAAENRADLRRELTEKLWGQPR